ncbi:MAG: type II secretion system F family protein [Kiritimatiellia bacterium]
MNASVLGFSSMVLWAIATGLFAWYALDAARQVTYVTLADGRRQERRLPLLFRMLLPLAPNFKKAFSGASFEHVRDRVDQQLTAGGVDGLLSNWEFLSMKVLLPLCLGPFWILLVHLLSRLNPILSRLFVPLSLLGLLTFYSYPMLWLRSCVRIRQAKILRSLPFVLDLLTLSVEAGLDFMMALQRCTERPVIDPLTEELIRVIRETQLGTPRRDALRAMANRIGLSDVRAIVNALVQADELGVSVGAILRIQSDQVRSRRFERAERLANEAPVKLLGPLLFFIFPAVFLILLGPVFYQMMHTI